MPQVAPEYMRYRILTNHDAQCLMVGDEVEFTGANRIVTKVTRKQSAMTITLDDGYSFDARQVGLTNLTIYRPMAKFRPASASVPQDIKRDEDEGIPLVKDSTKKNRSARKKAGSRK